MKPGEMIGKTNWSMLDDSRHSDGAKSDGQETKKKLQKQGKTFTPSVSGFAPKQD